MFEAFLVIITITNLQFGENLSEELGFVHHVGRVLVQLLHLAVDREVGQAEGARQELGKPVVVGVLAVVDQVVEHVKQVFLRTENNLGP